ncbi:hypothetical protein N4G58_16730 [Edwardsiella piscicida]|nr:hypothetical protein N4G58_16730 [Edwardsiella piscicida]
MTPYIARLRYSVPGVTLISPRRTTISIPSKIWHN